MLKRPTHIFCRVHFVVPQRIPNAPRAYQGEWLTVRQQAEWNAAQYIKTIAALPEADDLLLGLVEQVEQRDAPE